MKVKGIEDVTLVMEAIRGRRAAVKAKERPLIAGGTVAGGLVPPRTDHPPGRAPAHSGRDSQDC